MPVCQDWMTRPLQAVASIFDQNKTGIPVTCTDVVKFFTEKLAQDGNWEKIPSLNNVPLRTLANGQLVRFRCMIQDMHGKEIFLSQYEVENMKTGTITRRCGLFQDVVHLAVDETATPEGKMDDREVWYCISVPGENNWVQTASIVPVALDKNAGDAISRSEKHSLDDDSDDEMLCDETSVSSKRHCMTASSAFSSASSSKFSPLPDMAGITCIVKVYEMPNLLKVNDAVEFVGVFSLESPDQDEMDVEMGLASKEEANNCDTPASVVPKIHVICYCKMPHWNPLIKELVPLPDVSEIRVQMLAFLTECFMGDELTAEYFLYHMVSKIYIPSDERNLGKFALNINQIPTSVNFPQKLYNIISKLVTKSCCIPLTLEAINGKSFIPKKDYNTNRLVTSVLQLSDHTEVVLDETVLTSGPLINTGTENFAALDHLIRHQNVNYNFEFYGAGFPCDLPILVLSEGRSCLPVDFGISLKPNGQGASVTKESVEELYASIEKRLIDPFLTKFRRFLTVARFSPYEFDKSTEKFVNDEFVRMRQELGPKKMTPEDLHLLLVLSRNIAVTIGSTVFTEDIWKRAVFLETTRKARIEEYDNARRVLKVEENQTPPQPHQ